MPDEAVFDLCVTTTQRVRSFVGCGSCHATIRRATFDHGKCVLCAARRTVRRVRSHAARRTAKPTFVELRSMLLCFPPSGSFTDVIEQTWLALQRPTQLCFIDRLASHNDNPRRARRGERCPPFKPSANRPRVAERGNNAAVWRGVGIYVIVLNIPLFMTMFSSISVYYIQC